MLRNSTTQRDVTIGQGLWRIKDRSFVCQHQLHPDELELFDTTGRMVSIPRKFKNPEA